MTLDPDHMPTAIIVVQLTGALIVRDSRATEEANETYLDMLEDYFAQPTERLREDLRPELGYQVVSVHLT